MTQMKSLVRCKPRLEWTNLDWANYLQCPIQEVPSIRNFLYDNYVMGIERNRKTNRYSFVMYRYHIAPSGFKSPQLLLSASDEKHTFSNEKDAIEDANKVISSLELSDFWADALNVPKCALQMMLIREK